MAHTPRGPLGREITRNLSATTSSAADWHDDAVCTRFPVEQTDAIFFPTRTGAASDAYEQAREMCSACPVIHKCLEKALEDEMNEHWVHGFRAGMKAQERVELRNQLRGTRAVAA